MKRIFIIVLGVLLASVPALAQGNKITMAAVDMCGFMLKGSVTITATVLTPSPVTVASIQMQVDGMNIGMPLTAPPYSLTWDSTTVMPGCHTITGVVEDTAGNSVTVSVPVSVKNK